MFDSIRKEFFPQQKPIKNPQEVNHKACPYGIYKLKIKKSIIPKAVNIGINKRGILLIKGYTK